MKTLIVAALMLYVIDGDTIVVQPKQGPTSVHVRLAHIDTPEIHGFHCAHELELGKAARAWLSNRLPAGKAVVLLPIPKHDKYGRMLAVVTQAGENINVTLVQRGMAVPYEGKHKPSWCN